MTDYISRDAAIAVIEERARLRCHAHDLISYKYLKLTKWDIADIPAADVRPVVRGKWEDVEVCYVADKTTLPFERISSMRCNQCNRYHTEIYYYGDPTEMVNFCSNCGAKMEVS